MITLYTINTLNTIFNDNISHALYNTPHYYIHTTYIHYTGKYLDRKKKMDGAPEVVVKQYPILANTPGNRNPMTQSIRSEH